MNPTFLIASAAAFALVTGLVLWLSLRLYGDREVDSRLDGLNGTTPQPPRKESSERDAIRQRFSRFAAGLLPNNQAERERLQTRLMWAGIYAPGAVGVYLFTRIFLTLLPLVMGLVAARTGWGESHQTLLWGAIGGLGGLLLPDLWLRSRKNQRHEVLQRSLADFLDLAVACVESGLSLEGALQRVTEELQIAHPMLAGEMHVVQRQIHLGAAPETALKNFADRTDFEPLHTLSGLIQHSRRFGTSVGETLRTHAEMLRTQREQRLEELAQKTSVKILFPTLLFIFPAIFVILAAPAAIKLSESFGQPGTEEVRSE